MLLSIRDGIRIFRRQYPPKGRVTVNVARKGQGVSDWIGNYNKVLMGYCCSILPLLVFCALFVGCGCGGGGPTQFTLTVAVEGHGTVEPGEGTHRYVIGTMVELTATSVASWEFVRWEGELVETDQEETTAVMDKSKTVKAIFEPLTGAQTNHSAAGVIFHMRLAPVATFPTGMDDSDTVTVDAPFWIAETQVTYELWYTVRQWALSNGYAFANVGREGSHGDTGQAPMSKRYEPVTRVNWRERIVWANALSEMLGYQPVYTYQGHVIRDSTNAEACDNATQEYINGFRLPRSSEWELAARYKGHDSSQGAILRGGLWWTPGHYASGATADYENASATQEVAWYSANSGDSTKDVGLLRANGLGLFDMSGSVREWCFTQIGFARVYRGGSWSVDTASMRVGCVSSYRSSRESFNFGLRLARCQNGWR